MFADQYGVDPARGAATKHFSVVSEAAIPNLLAWGQEAAVPFTGARRILGSADQLDSVPVSGRLWSKPRVRAIRTPIHQSFAAPRRVGEK